MKKLLIVEDDLLLDEAYKRKFQSKFDLKVVDNGEDGVNEAINWKPDGILLDVYMPGKYNGIDVLKQVKENPGVQNTPVLVITNLPDTVDMALKLGASKCLMKTDVDLDLIERELDNLMG